MSNENTRSSFNNFNNHNNFPVNHETSISKATRATNSNFIRPWTEVTSEVALQQRTEQFNRNSEASIFGLDENSDYSSNSLLLSSHKTSTSYSTPSNYDKGLFGSDYSFDSMLHSTYSPNSTYSPIASDGGRESTNYERGLFGSDYTSELMLHSPYSNISSYSSTTSNIEAEKSCTPAKKSYTSHNETTYRPLSYTPIPLRNVNSSIQNVIPAATQNENSETLSQTNVSSTCYNPKTAKKKREKQRIVLL